MIYLKTSIGIELTGEDILISSVQGNFSGGVFTRFARIAGYRSRDKEDLRREINHTDRGAFKAALKSDEILLQGILDRLRVPASRT